MGYTFGVGVAVLDGVGVAVFVGVGVLDDVGVDTFVVGVSVGLKTIIGITTPE